MRILFALPLIGFLAACANTGSNYMPVIDGAVGPNFSADLAACQNIAASQGALGNDAGVRTVAGAGAAAAGTAIISNTGNNVRDAAAVGAIAGITSAAVAQNQRKEQIIRQCMRGRGYNVVG